jgi:AcrR family transcriptional regulator
MWWESLDVFHLGNVRPRLGRDSRSGRTGLLKQESFVPPFLPTLAPLKGFKATLHYAVHQPVGHLTPYTVFIVAADRPFIPLSADPRRLILDALIETAACEGYAHTCIERVLSAANLAEADFYAYFESLEDCFIQASDQLIDELELVVLGRMSIDAPWPERIRRGLRAMLWVIAEHPDRARFAMIECLGAGQPAAERLRSAEAMFAVVVEEGREYAANVELLPVEHLTQLTAEGIVGGIATIVHRRVFEEDTAELPALLSDLLYIALMPYLGHERALAVAS